jgi:DNA (cytosine-5)-methyltransferase 1
MTDLTFVELFAGVGGMSRGLETAGWRCVGHAEWDAHARAVLRTQWPAVPLWGDVSQLNGHDIVQEVGPFTMLTFGAPCQDFSIAGKRSGMDGERSVLVLDALRIWEESQAPFALYENVVGMLSSNKGEDFAGILSVFVGDAVAVPARGWKGGGGIVRGRRGVAAWRVLDAQYFGVPQRRRRVFVLGTRHAGIDPAEVLSLLDGVSGHPAPRRAPRQGVATDAGRGAALAVNISGGVGRLDPVMGTLDADGASTTAIGAQTRGVVLAFAQNTRDEVRVVPNDIVCALAAQPGMKQQNYILTYDARGNGEGVVVNALTGDHNNRVTDYTAIILRNREGKPGGGKGPLLSEGKSLTLGTSNDQVVFMVDKQTGLSTEGIAPTLKTDLSHQMGPVLAPALTMGAHPAAPGLNGQDAHLFAAALHAVQPGIPRRLTPVECERLMGWPDGWTAQGLDEQGRAYALSDTARYKACGNGVASPVAAWIGFRLREVLEGSSWEVAND